MAKKPTITSTTKFRRSVSESSKNYLKRQVSDQYVLASKKAGYRSRAAYKLIELNEKLNFIKPGMSVVDLGSSPGGWCQVLSEKLGDKGKILAADIILMKELPHVEFIKGDFTEDETYERVLASCPEKVDVVLSDMAPSTSGHAGADHLQCMMLAELAADFAEKMLKEGGLFICKIFQGGEEVAFRNALRKLYDKVAFVKPDASRSESREIFIVATGFKG